MSLMQELLEIIDECLGLKGRALKFSVDTALLGAIPELDSMAVVALITAMEDRFGLSFNDDEIDGEMFATVGSLSAVLQSKLAA